MFKRFFLFVSLVMVAILCSSCISSMNEPRPDFPDFSTVDGDPGVGLLEIRGSNSTVIEFHDQAGRLVMKWSEAGQSPVMRINGRYKTRIYRFWAELGRYKIKIRPYFYQNFPRRQLIELPVRYGSISVDRKVDTYHKKTGRYWGWVAKINVGNRPYHGPRLDLGIKATGLPKLLLDSVLQPRIENLGKRRRK